MSCRAPHAPHLTDIDGDLCSGGARPALDGRRFMRSTGGGYLQGVPAPQRAGHPTLRISLILLGVFVLGGARPVPDTWRAPHAPHLTSDLSLPPISRSRSRFQFFRIWLIEFGDAGAVDRRAVDLRCHCPPTHGHSPSSGPQAGPLVAVFA